MSPREAFSAPPYLRGVYAVPERVASWDEHPFTLPFVRALDLKLRTPVVFFVGENGSGKSTLLEAIAALLRLPVSGGGRNEAPDDFAPDDGSPLARALRPQLVRHPRDSFFFRAEHLAHFAELLDARRDDPDFIGSNGPADPYASYGGGPLHQRSHGEVFLDVITNRLNAGLFLMDEPESALSPQRQLALLARVHELVEGGASQFVIATHSPILLTYPGAQIITFDDGALAEIQLEQTSHYQITRGILDAPERYWRHLRSAPR